MTEVFPLVIVFMLLRIIGQTKTHTFCLNELGHKI
jgi:hypothetical protein